MEGPKKDGNFIKMNLVEIAQAWIDAANPTFEQQERAEKRLKICNQCPQLKYIDILQIYICSQCGCPISKKIYTNKKPGCPLEKWEE